MRIPQPPGARGSLKWIQHFVAHRPDLLQPSALPPITWLSPLSDDDFAEYRDGAFLDRLGLANLSSNLSAFWPARGPQWDALGRTEHGPVLVEAKAHVAEFLTPGTQAGDASRRRIDAAFNRVMSDLSIRPRSDWANVYYQYANRIAHLWWLRQQGIAASLVFVSFLNDAEMGGPATAETWEAMFAAANYALGLPESCRVNRHVHHVYPGVGATLPG